MPCYQVNIISVEFLAENVGFLLKALETLNMQFNYDKDYNVIYLGSIIINLGEQRVEAPETAFRQVNKIKRQYSREVVQEIAKKKRWVLTQQNSRNITLKKW